MPKPTEMYRIRPYKYGFEIQKYYYNTKKKEGSWVAYKYPSDLAAACTTLLELFVHEGAQDTDTSDIHLLIEAVKSAKEDAREVARELELSGLL